jgi:hypothetical protein
MASKLPILILNSLTNTKQRTLHELYIIVKDSPDFDWEDSVGKHRVRSAIDALLRNKKIKRVAQGTYALNIHT